MIRIAWVVYEAKMLFRKGKKYLTFAILCVIMHLVFASNIIGATNQLTNYQNVGGRVNM